MFQVPVTQHIATLPPFHVNKSSPNQLLLLSLQKQVVALKCKVEPPKCISIIMDIGISISIAIAMHSCHFINYFLLGMPCEPEHHSQNLPEGHHSWSISLTDSILKTVPQQPHQHQLPCMEVDFVGSQIPVLKKMGAKKSSTICWLKELTFPPP